VDEDVDLFSMKKTLNAERPTPNAQLKSKERFLNFRVHLCRFVVGRVDFVFPGMTQRI
jgi:hypothetical protein